MEGGESDRANRSNRANGSNRSNRVSEKAIAEGGGSQAIHGHPGYIMCDALALYEIGQGRHTTYYTVRASTPEVGSQASRGAKATLWGRQHVRCLQRRP